MPDVNEHAETEDEEAMAIAGETEGKWYFQLFKRTKEWFEAEPDAE